MLAFKGKETYEEYVRVIGNGMTSDTFEFLRGAENERGFSYLVSIKDEKLRKKIMKTLATVDKDMDTFPKKDEMYRKLTFFLKVGILFQEYPEYMKELTPEAISTLATDNHFSMEEEAKKYVPLLSGNDFLLALRKEYRDGERDEIMFAITQHYDKDSFDVSEKEKVKEFQERELKRLRTDKKEFLSDVMSFSDLAELVLNRLNNSGVRK